MVHGCPLRGTQPSTLRARGEPYMGTASKRNSVSLERIASYRAPLPPHLARHKLVYLISKKDCNVLFWVFFYFCNIKSLNHPICLFQNSSLTYKEIYDKISDVEMEEYPSLAEGIGLENRQAGQTARGFKSLFLHHT